MLRDQGKPTFLGQGEVAQSRCKGMALHATNKNVRDWVDENF